MMMSASSTQATPTSSPTGSVGSFNNFSEGGNNYMASCSNSRHYYMYRLALKQTTPASSEINTNKTNASYNNRPSRKPSDSPQVSEKYTSFHKRGGLPLPHRRQLNNKNNPAKGSTPTSGGGDDDTFLSQYIKSLEIQTTLNDHQL